VSLYSTDPNGQRRVLIARDAGEAQHMLRCYRAAAEARGGSLRDAGHNVWHAISVDGIHYATLTLT
jgi:hypothetical protein